MPGAPTPAPSPASSATTLDELHAAVTAQHDALKARGINIVAWGPDPAQQRERLTIQNLTPTKETILDTLFGATRLILTSTPYPAAADGRPALPKPGITLPSPGVGK